MDARATARLFGRFVLRLDGRTVTPLASARAESVLALLLMQDEGSLPRRRAASVLWPGSTEAQARTNLRHVLHHLRQDVSEIDRYVEITPRELRLRPGMRTEIDVCRFERLLSAPGTRSLTDLRAAADLYTGDLLEDCEDEWPGEHRDRLRRRYHDTLAELVARCEEEGAFAEGIRHAERLQQGDPLREETYRRLMRLYAAAGDRTAAVRVFHGCCATLERELQVAPSPETRAVYESLLPDQRADGPDPWRSPAGPLVGRRDERARLGARWRAVKTGELRPGASAVRFVLLHGDPGVGKSRLAEEFGAWCRRRGARVADARCHTVEGPLAYGVVTTWLRADAIRPGVIRMDTARVSEISRLVPEVLVERPDVPEPVVLAEAEQRRRLFDAVATALTSPARPALLVVDDVHAVDRETCRLLHYLLRVPSGPGVLVLATGRREEMEAGDPAHDLLTTLHAEGAVEEIELGPLDPRETVELAEHLAAGPLDSAEAGRIVAETEGNPLFVVEAIRAGWTSTSGPTPRLQSAVEVRLARLGPQAREVASLAAAIGRDVDVDVLRAAARVDEDTLVRSLDDLWRRRVLRERSGGDGHGGAYDFSHGLIRQVVLDATPPAQRRRLHERIATALERVHAPDPERVAARIAVHLACAGATGRAVAWFRRAARAARALHANDEAVRLLERALTLLADEPDSPARRRRELAMRIDLLAPLVAVAAYESPRMRATQARAVALNQALGTEPSPPLVRSLALSALTRSDFTAATGLGRDLARAARRDHDRVLEVEAAYVLGVASFWQAELETARHHFEHALARYRVEDTTIHQLHYAQDPKVVCLGRLANTLWFLGHVDEAARAVSATLDWADRIGHPFSRTIALTFAALLALDMGDERAVREHTSGLLAAEEETVSLHVVEAFRGHVAVLDGHVEAGLATVRAAAAGVDPVGAAPGQHAFLVRVLLASCLAGGDTAGARTAADKLLAMEGPGRLWAPVARAARAALVAGGTVEERSAAQPARPTRR